MKFEKTNGIIILMVTIFNLADNVCQIRKKVKNGKWNRYK